MRKEASPVRVVVAMSGGVDSSVAAALLARQGYHVIGMMMRLWSESGREIDNRCCTPDAMAQARRVAAILGIPFYVVDAQDVFRRTVVEYFMNGYAAGETPNPCLVCNRHIRWEFLLQRARALGAHKMATGHDVRLDQDEAGRFHIRKAVDEAKDQSYVLHVLGQEQLGHALFPLGRYTKPEIRRMAAEFGLPVAERPDSQDLCFLGGDDYRAFLRRNLPGVETPGPIVTRMGRQVGEHHGLAFYTIGQRKGLDIPGPKPMFVLAKDLQRNTLIVGEQSELGQARLTAGAANWIAGEPPAQSFRADVKIRYKARPAPGLVSMLDGDRFRVEFDEPLRDITPGQAAVVYSGDVCLGGGIIQP
jgi:tRNA-specific 2-thiouridylase